MKPVSCVLLLLVCCGCSSAALRQENESLRAALDHTLRKRDETLLERRERERTRSGKLQLCTTLFRLSSRSQGKSNLHLLELDDEKTYGAAKIATADVAEGLLIVLTGGLTRAHRPEVVEYLKKEFGIDYVYLCGCVAPESVWQFMDAYNKVSEAAIKKKTGKAFCDILDSKPVEAALDRAAAREKVEYEKSCKEEALRKKRTEALRKNMRPLLEKGDFARARETAGDNFTDSYRDYLDSTHPWILDVEIAHYDTAPVNVNFVDATVADVIKFLNSVPHNTRQGGGPIVIEAPEPQKAELLKQTVTLRMDKAPISGVIMQLTKRAGLRVGVRRERVVLYPPPKK